MFKHLKLAVLSISFVIGQTLMPCTKEEKLQFPKTKGEFLESVFIVPFSVDEFKPKSDLIEIFKARITKKIEGICSVIEEFKSKSNEPFSQEDFKKFGDTAFTQTFSDQDVETIMSKFKDTPAAKRSKWISWLIRKTLAEVLFDLHKDMTKESAVFITLFLEPLERLIKTHFINKGFYGS